MLGTPSTEQDGRVLERALGIHSECKNSNNNNNNDDHDDHDNDDNDDGVIDEDIAREVSDKSSSDSYNRE